MLVWSLKATHAGCFFIAHDAELNDPPVDEPATGPLAPPEYLNPGLLTLVVLCISPDGPQALSQTRAPGCRTARHEPLAAVVPATSAVP
eukprot:gene4201-14306_t